MQGYLHLKKRLYWWQWCHVQAGPTHSHCGTGCPPSRDNRAWDQSFPNAQHLQLQKGSLIQYLLLPEQKTHVVSSVKEIKFKSLYSREWWHKPEKQKALTVNLLSTSTLSYLSHDPDPHKKAFSRMSHHPRRRARHCSTSMHHIPWRWRWCWF